MKHYFSIILIFLSLSIKAQIISTFAGGGTGGDGGPATAASVTNPHFVVFDRHGNFYFSEFSACKIREVDTNGIIHTIAGTGLLGYGGDGGPATAATFKYPEGIAFDTSGNLFIADHQNYRVRKIDMATGIISTYAGNGVAGSSGDGGPATAAEFIPGDIKFDKQNNLYISDGTFSKIRKVNTANIISTYAGTGVSGFMGDGGPATVAELFNPYGIAIDDTGNLYVAVDSDYRIRKIDTFGIIQSIAGTGIGGIFNGDGIPAASADITPVGLVINHNNIYFSDSDDRVRMINNGDTVLTIAGDDTIGYNGDDIIATSAWLYGPGGIAFDVCGNMYFADADNNRIRKVGFLPNPIILTNTLTATFTDTICTGTSVTFTATTTTSSGAITYQWYVNGSPIAATSGSSYTYTPANGDSVRCVATAANACTSTTVSSNTIYMVVNPYTVPTITVMAPASAPVGSMVTVNATVAGAGSSYNINWYNDAVLFNTTTVPVVTYVKDSGVDVITATVVPGGEGGCYDSTTSAAVSVTVNNEGITTPYPLLKTGGGVYPNPVSDVVHVDGDVVSYKMMSMVGALLLQGDLKPGSNSIDVGGLAAGVYMLEVADRDGGKIIAKIVKQ